MLHPEYIGICSVCLQTKDLQNAACMLTVLKRKLAAIGSMPFARSPLSVAVIPGLLPVLVSFRRFRAFSHARMFSSVFALSTSFRQAGRPAISPEVRRRLLGRPPVADPPLPHRAVRPQRGRETFRRRAIKRETSVAGKVFRWIHQDADRTYNDRRREWTRCVKCHSDGKVNDETYTGP